MILKFIQLISILFSVKIYFLLSILHPLKLLSKNSNHINIPNYITLFRLLFCFLFFFPNFFPYAILLNVILDILDGFFAKKLNQQTDFGCYLDSYTDTVFHTLSFIYLGTYIFPEFKFLSYMYPLLLYGVQLFPGIKFINLPLIFKYFSQLINVLLLIISFKLNYIGILFLGLPLFFYNLKQNAIIYAIIQLIYILMIVMLTFQQTIISLFVVAFLNIFTSLLFLIKHRVTVTKK